MAIMTREARKASKLMERNANADGTHGQPYEGLGAVLTRWERLRGLNTTGRYGFSFTGSKRERRDYDEITRYLDALAEGQW